MARFNKVHKKIIGKIPLDKRIKNDELINYKGGSLIYQCCCVAYGCISWFTTICDYGLECDETIGIVCGDPNAAICVRMN